MTVRPTGHGLASDRLVETGAAALVIVLYVLVVSRGEILPVAGPARFFAAPLIAVCAFVLIVWRLRQRIPVIVSSPTTWWGAIAIVGLVLGLGFRLWVGPIDRPASPSEATIVASSLALMRDRAPAATDAADLALAWLHAPVAAYVYVAGVSAGLWERIGAVTVEAALPWSRGLHLAMSLVTIVLTGIASARVAGRSAGWLAAALVALNLPSVTGATTIDLAAPSALIVALGLFGLATVMTRNGPGGRRLERWVLIALAAVALAILWLPGVVAAIVAPAAALVASASLVTLWSLFRSRG